MDRQRIKDYKYIKAAAAMLKKELRELQTFAEPDQQLITKLKQRESEYITILNDIESRLEKIKDPIAYTILKMKLYNNASDSEIAELLCYSRSQITRIKNKCIREWFENEIKVKK